MREKNEARENASLNEGWKNKESSEGWRGGEAKDKKIRLLDVQLSSKYARRS